MTELVGPWGMSLGAWALAATVWTGAVFVVVRVLEWLLGRVLQPRARMALYGLVLLRLCLPPDWSTPVGVVGGSEHAAAAAPAAGVTELEAPSVVVPWLSRGGAPTEAGTATVAAAVQRRPPWLELGYAFGVVLLAAVGLRRRGSLRRVVAEARPAPPAVAALAGPVGSDATAAPPLRVVVHPTCGPFAWGLRQRVIVLSEPLVAKLGPEELACVVAHERAHHAGRDTWLSAALAIITTVAWPILPVWLAARRVRALMEHAADERALGDGRDARRRYGRVLLQLVEHARTPADPAPSLGAYRDLRARIVSIVRPATAPRSVQVAVALAVVGVVVACAAVAPEPGQSPRAADCDALEQRAYNLHDAAEKLAGHQGHPDAVAAYDEYFAACEAHPNYADVTYMAAEAHWAFASELYRAGDPEGAAKRFMVARALFDRAIDEGSSYTPDAAYAQHLSTRNATGWQPADDGPPCDDCGDQFPRLPYSEPERAVVASWQRYAAVVGRPLRGKPKDQLAMARLMMQHNDFDRARPDLEELTELHAGTAEGLAGAEMLIDVLTIRWISADDEDALSRGNELLAWIDAIQASATYDMPGAAALAKAAVTLAAAVRWKQVMATLARAEATGDADAFRACAETLERILAEHPEHSEADKLRRNAARCREHASR